MSEATDDTAPEISDNGDVSWFEQRGLNATLSDFEGDGAGVYRYRSALVQARIDFNMGTLKVSNRDVDTASVNVRDGIDAELHIGGSPAVYHVRRPRS